MIGLTQVLNGYITPALSPLGFKKTGNTYRLVAENGDQALVNFQRSAGRPPEVVFYINVAVAPSTFVQFNDYQFGRQHPEQPGPEDGLYRDRLMPDQDMKSDPLLQTDERWHFTDRDSANRVGAHLAELLGKIVGPKLVTLVDRDRFLDYVLESKENMPWPSEGPPRSHVVLLIDKAPSPQFSAALKQSEEIGDDKLIEWVEQYLASNNSPGGLSAI
jgi:hypothetical protein